jgi:serine/threonine protein kinase
VRSDLFALGLVLYELFTGKRAFPAEDRQELLKRYDSGAPSKPSSMVLGLGDAVERVILRCLARAPEDRPRSAYEVMARCRVVTRPGGSWRRERLRLPGWWPKQAVRAGCLPRSGASVSRRSWWGWRFPSPSSGTSWSHEVPLPKSPEVLIDKSRELLKKLGHDQFGTALRVRSRQFVSAMGGRE